MIRWYRPFAPLSGVLIGIALGQWLGNDRPWFALLLIPGIIGTIPLALDVRRYIRYRKGVNTDMTEGKHRKHHRFSRWVLRHLERRVLVTIYHRLVPLPWRIFAWVAKHVLGHEVRKHRKEGSS